MQEIGSEILSFADGLSKIGPALAGAIVFGVILVFAFWFKLRYDRSELEKRIKEWEFDQKKLKERK